MLRLGDGTPKSHQFVQEAVNELWKYTGELFQMSTYENELLEKGYALNLDTLLPAWQEKIDHVFAEAGITKPADENFLSGGKEGKHTEHMGYILTELQYMQRTYPAMKW
jgi:ring-1,2-phenylacetyl-CoA epoxidase subunit PaaC